MNRRTGGVLGVLAAVSLCLLSGTAFGAGKGDWELSDDGKRWQYRYGKDDPAQDEWIETDGKEYYVDSKGYLKTGWVTDAWDGSKYYTGEDGAKRFNMFTPDDHYVGPEGTILERFDTYRKETKKQLKKKFDTAETPGFLLMDLNGDGYQDIVAANRAEHPDQVLMVAVWDPEEETMILSAEADGNSGSISQVTYNSQLQATWLVITDRSRNNIDYFRLDEGSGNFENVWYFTTAVDDWGDPEYGVNGRVTDPEAWYLAIAAADAEAGSPVADGYLPLEESYIKQAVDCVPAQEELRLWED